MKVKLFSTYDSSGGAAIAFLRLTKALRKYSIEVECSVQSKSTDYNFIHAPKSNFRKLLSKVSPKFEYSLLKLFYKNLKKSTFSSFMYMNDKKLFNDTSADILNLHWTGHGFASINGIKKINKPVVITLHDMSALTGGCYYSGECSAFTDKCGRCSILNSNKENDLSSFVLSKKLKEWKDLNITLTAPSSWMAEKAKSSALFRERRIALIPYCIDTKLFKPAGKSASRNLLNLPSDKKILLFGAVAGTSDPRKGFDLLKKSLNYYSSDSDSSNVHLVIFGQSEGPETIHNFPVTYAGVIKDEYSMVMLYSAADLFLLPSREDNLPNTVLESLSCGTPVAAFNTGGIPDMITHKKNGFLSKKFDTEEFACGIKYCIENESRLNELSNNARETAVQNYNEEVIAEKYINLYKEILSNRK